MGEQGLDKEGLIEVQAIISTEFVEMKSWIKETMVCQQHCGKKSGKLTIWLVVITIGLSAALGMKTLAFLRLIGMI